MFNLYSFQTILPLSAVILRRRPQDLGRAMRDATAHAALTRCLAKVRAPR